MTSWVISICVVIAIIWSCSYIIKDWLDGRRKKDEYITMNGQVLLRDKRYAFVDGKWVRAEIAEYEKEKEEYLERRIGG